MSALESGSTLGRYTLLLPVGQGGQAAVWAASFAGLAGFEKTVAVKTLLPPRDEEEAHIERFTDEALLATRLRHPNVVEVLDFGEEDGVLYIVMPWIDGEPVNAIIDGAAKKGGIPLAVTANLVGQVCRGLHAAHELRSELGEPLGLVHRDVSPENILVAREGVAKLADFGVATACGHLGLITGETDLGRARGKVWYMAPEELWGEPVDRRADLFALGVVLYRMTTGRHPFASGTGRESVRRLLAGAEPVPPRSFLPDYPEALEALVLRALAERPDDRPRTALELRQALFNAVTPASDDDVAQFLAELFSGRRLERDEKLRVALEARPEPPRARFRQDDARREGQRSNRKRGRARAVGLALGIAGLVALGFVATKASVSLPTPEVKAAEANLGARYAEPIAVSHADTPVRAETAPLGVLPSENRPTATEPTGERVLRRERRAIDVSPVRDVGF
jgi:serine/threonine protein kinase